MFHSLEHDYSEHLACKVHVAFNQWEVFLRCMKGRRENHITAVTKMERVTAFGSNKAFQHPLDLVYKNHLPPKARNSPNENSI
jgi:hypothetical protein